MSSGCPICGMPFTEMPNVDGSMEHTPTQCEEYASTSSRGASSAGAVVAPASASAGVGNLIRKYKDIGELQVLKSVLEMDMRYLSSRADFYRDAARRLAIENVVSSRLADTAGRLDVQRRRVSTKIAALEKELTVGPGGFDSDDE